MHQRGRKKKRVKHLDYDFNVFINCPFDDKYKPLFRAMIFTIHSCGFIARCAQEDSTQNIRFSRILDIIGESRYGIHDLSRINLKENVMPRNNMPLELGVFIGCQEFGTAYDYEKEYLVLDSIPHRYKEHITDLGGQDPSIHFNKQDKIVGCVRDWLKPRAPTTEQRKIASASIMSEQLALFYKEAIDICRKNDLVLSELSFLEFVDIVTNWIDSKRHTMEEFDKLTPMGLMNSVVKRFNECPITGEKASYNFISPNPGIDGYEYKLESLNPYTIICITGSALDDGYLSKLREHKDIIRNMIVHSREIEFTVDTHLLSKLER